MTRALHLSLFRWLIPACITTAMGVLLSDGPAAQVHTKATQSRPHSITDTLWRQAPLYRSIEEALAQQALGQPVYRLDLSRQGLREAPHEIAALTDLRELRLRKNRLSALPDSWSTLTHLEEFDASLNRLAAFPPVILHWTQLRHLDLGDNNLDGLPEDIDVLRKLEILSVWSNPLERYPASLSDLPALQKLDLLHNLLDPEEHQWIQELLPGVVVILSPPCQCDFNP